MTEKDYRKEGEEMEKKKKKKYSRTDKVILGIGFTILGLFVLSIAIPIIYNPSPSFSFLTTWFTKINKITFTTELKRPTAVEYP